MTQYIIHKSGTRGHADHGWLDSHHTFSFANYHNPERMNFGMLRVLNDDVVEGGKGFGSHPHDNMEIISIPLQGSLEHKDNTGRKAIIKTNDVQIMSAGTGIVHSEFNASGSEKVNFLQLWVFPKLRNIQPRYDQHTYPPGDRVNKIQTVVAPGENGTLMINQDAWFSLSNLNKDFTLQYEIKKPGNGTYLFVIDGNITVDGHSLNKRDGIGIWNANKFSINAETNAELLLIEVPMS